MCFSYSNSMSEPVIGKKQQGWNCWWTPKSLLPGHSEMLSGEQSKVVSQNLQWKSLENSSRDYAYFNRGPHPQASANACSCKASHQTFCTKGPSWIWSVLPTTVYTTQRTVGWQIHWRNLSQAPLWSMWTIMANVLPLQMDPAQNANSCLPRHSAWYIIHTVPQKRNWCWQTFREQDTICMILKLPQKKTFLMLMQMKCTSAVETSPQLEWRLSWRNTSAIPTAPWWVYISSCLSQMAHYYKLRYITMLFGITTKN